MSNVIKSSDPTKELVKAIAKDIADEVAHHIKTMYPKAVLACPSTLLLSVKGCIQNEIMAAIQVNEQGQIISRLNERKKFRKKVAKVYSDLRKSREEHTAAWRLP